tara:strand:+ start:13188 stop:13418 length:231 start_codon:yes stop_codon:yes gene_type:complete
MAMTATEIVATIDRLEAAKLDLALGKTRASVTYDGRSVSFTQTDAGKINALIAELRAKLAALGAGPRQRRGFTVQF